MNILFTTTKYDFLGSLVNLLINIYCIENAKPAIAEVPQ